MRKRVEKKKLMKQKLHGRKRTSAQNTITTILLTCTKSRCLRQIHVQERVVDEFRGWALPGLSIAMCTTC